MEDIIAIKVVTGSEKKFFLTWGRIFDRVDEQKIIDIIKGFLSVYRIKEYQQIRVCESIQEASSAKYFFECLFKMSQKKIPFGVGYKKWQSSMRKKIETGKEIYFLG